MKRPHRSIETFDISLMAVVTKAMGAFLVLMLLLMPYYRSGPIGQKEADDLAKKTDEVRNSLSVILERLTNASVEDLRALLEEMRAQLEEARKLIAKLKHLIDQLNAQVARLEEENTAFKTEIAGLKEEKAALTDRVAELQNQIDPLKARIAELENQIEPLKARIAELEKQIAPLKRENDWLKAKVAELENIVDPLKREKEALKAANLQLQQEKNLMAARIAELEKTNESLKAEVIDLMERLFEKRKGTMDENIRRIDETKKSLTPQPALQPPKDGAAPGLKKEQMKRPAAPADLDKLRQQAKPSGSQGSPTPQVQPGGQH